jgi:uncharacterized integral membrane protein (TIGR00698 family)
VGHTAEVLPGLTLAVVIAAAASLVAMVVPIVGGPVTGIVIGCVVTGFAKPGVRFQPGIGVSSRLVLQVSVVVLGAQLSLAQVAHVGVSSLPVMLGTLLVCLVAAYLVGRWLGVGGDVRTLIGVGTGICGASAIAAVTPVIEAASVDVAFAVSTIFLFNVAAVLTFPLLGHVLGLSQHSFGLFAGTAVNDVSSVVAASTTYGSAAARYAIVVKLTRTLLIIPICFGLAALNARRTSSAVSGDAVPTPGTPRPRRAGVTARRLVPWFLPGFLLLATVNSIGGVPHGAQPALHATSVFLITVALSAIGLSTDVAGFRRTGPRPLILGAILWVTVSATSLGLQSLTAWFGLGVG